MNTKTNKNNNIMNKTSLFSILSILIFCISCQHQDPKTMAVSVLIDGTDTLTLLPEKEKIYQLFHLDAESLEEIETGVQLKVSSISHVDINQSHEASIPAVSYRTVNAIVRQDEIKAFYQDADAMFEKAEDKKAKNHSSIFIPISKEANRLASIGVGEKYLIINSDLMENSDWLNAYKQHNLSEGKLIEKIEQHIELEDLTGLTIIIRFIPKDTKENVRYRKLYKVFKTLFESKGAIVTQEFSFNQNPQ